eukprot:639629-Rhodomonas_salina.1
MAWRHTSESVPASEVTALVSQVQRKRHGGTKIRHPQSQDQVRKNKHLLCVLMARRVFVVFVWCLCLCVCLCVCAGRMPAMPPTQSRTGGVGSMPLPGTAQTTRHQGYFGHATPPKRGKKVFWVVWGAQSKGFHVGRVCEKRQHDGAWSRGVRGAAGVGGADRSPAMFLSMSIEVCCTATKGTTCVEGRGGGRTGNGKGRKRWTAERREGERWKGSNEGESNGAFGLR